MQIFTGLMRFFLLIFLGTSFLIAGAQQALIDSLTLVQPDNPTSLKDKFSAIAKFYHDSVFTKPNQAIELSKFHFELALENNDGIQMAKAWNCRGIAHSVLGDQDQFLICLKQAIHLADTIDNPRFQATLQNNLGSFENFNTNYPKALEHFNNALEYHRKTDDLHAVASTLVNVGSVYRDVFELDLAYTYFDSAATIYQKAGENENLGYLHINLAIVQHEKEQFEKAIVDCRKAIQLHSRYNQKLDLGFSYFLLAQIYYAQSVNDSSRHYVNKALEIHEAIENHDQVLGEYNLLTKMHLDNNSKKASETAEKMKELLPNVYTIDTKVYAYERLEEVAKMEGNLEEALHMNELHKQYSDSLKLEESRLAVVRETLKREFGDRLSEEKRMSEAEKQTLKREQSKSIWGIIGLASLCIVVLLFFMRKRTKKQETERKEMLAQIVLLKQNTSLRQLSTAENATRVELTTEEIEQLKYGPKHELTPLADNASIPIFDDGFKLSRTIIEQHIDKELNETDWKVLELLAQDPVMSNKELSDKAFISVDGIGSSLRRMYVYFNVKESKYKKISLILDAIKITHTN